VLWVQWFPFQLADLAGHVVEEVFPGFASYKTVGELFVEASEFIDESCNIASAQVKFRD